MSDNAQADFGFARRSGTYEVRAVDGGRDPFGDLPAPLAIHTLTQEFMVIPRTATTAGTYDAARDALMGAVAHGFPVTLVYTTDGGQERVTRGKFMGIKDTPTRESAFRHTFSVSWEIGDWTDRAPRSIPVVGVGGKIIGGSPAFAIGGIVYSLAANPTTIAVYADGSDGFQKTTKADTGPTITINGPFGGVVTFDATSGAPNGGGFYVLNNQARIIDTNNNLNFVQFFVRKKLAAGDKVEIDCARKKATYTPTGGGAATLAFGTEFWIPDWQTEWFRVEAGIQSSIVFNGLGASPATGGTATVAWVARYF